jgi:hypothetical protein
VKTVLGDLRVTSRVLDLHIFIRFTFTRTIVKCRLVVLGLESDSSPVFYGTRTRNSNLDSDSKVGTKNPRLDYKSV